MTATECFLRTKHWLDHNTKYTIYVCVCTYIIFNKNMLFIESINRHASLSWLSMGDLILSEELVEVVRGVREEQEEGKDVGGTVVGTKMNHIFKSLTASMFMQVQWFMLCFLNPWTRSHSSYIHSSI